MLAKIGIGIVAVIHLGFAYKEIFEWTGVSSTLLKFDAELAGLTEVLGANQGAYNAFFAVGLLAVLIGIVPKGQRFALSVFCLASLTAAGAVGLLTIGHELFLVQLVPAAVALALVVRDRLKGERES